MRRSLTDIANHYGTDKGTVPPSPDLAAHNYTDVYAAYLEAFRESPITLLEMGLGVVGDRWEAKLVRGRNTGGASMKMWHEYFPNARLYGLDVNDAAYLDNERITTFVADQGSVADLDAFLNAIDDPFFDVVVDDASHRPDHQQIAFSRLFKHVKPGGLYFIEDLMANGFGDGMSGRMACDEVRNTRSVLKHFAETGTFPEPHALMEPDSIKDEIAGLSFHVPRVAIEPGAGHRTYMPDSELLCVVRKG